MMNEKEMKNLILEFRELEISQPAWTGHTYACDWEETINNYNGLLKATEEIGEAKEEFSAFARVFPLVEKGVIPFEEKVFVQLDTKMYKYAKEMAGLIAICLIK